MLITSPSGLHYPITIDKLLAGRDEQVKRSSPLFSYTYESTVSEGDRYGEVKDVKKRFPARFDSTAEGSLSRWFVKNGEVVHRAGTSLVEIEELCTHEVQFGMLCVNCGKDMTEVDYLTQERYIDRARINMTHDNTALLVSQKEAAKAEEHSRDRLLKGRKLSLIVDLDQTVIHTTCERTIAEWQEDPNNPNYDAVKDVKGFQLADDNVANVAANWYYVKMRPGLKDFFDRVAQMYEMHVYTMATRAYAQAVAKIIDPDRRYFGDRILSRDENYTDKLKSLHRLFPTNTDMVVIIDDRADIWHYSPNLVRVPVFNFFPGAGDINASFLPKQQELVTTSTKKKAAPVPDAVKQVDEGDSTQALSIAGKPAETASTGTSNGSLTDIEQQLVSMGAADSPDVIEKQVKEQEKVIITQQTERPLLQKQLLLDKEDEEADAVEENGDHNEIENGDAHNADHHRHRHSILHNDDRGLEIIEKHLKQIHNLFYAEYRQKTAAPPVGRVLELKGQKSPKKRLEEFIPDVKELMPRIKEEVLDSVTIVFSGIIPLGMDVENSDFAMWVKSFGARISLDVNKQTTHVVANPDRKTTKVKKAARYPHIKIVNAEWMLQCCTRWEHVDEEHYLIEVDQADRGSPFEDLDDTDIAATGDEDGTDPVNLDMSDENWAGLDDEFQAFMDESDDTDDQSNSDSESIQSDASTQNDSKRSQRKRKRAGTGSTDNSEADDSDASVDGTSRLQRRKKRTMERVTSLTNVLTAEKSSGLPSPDTTGPEEEQGELEKNPDPAGLAAGNSDPEDDDDGGLGAELLAELERSGSEGPA